MQKGLRVYLHIPVIQLCAAPDPVKVEVYRVRIVYKRHMVPDVRARPQAVDVPRFIVTFPATTGDPSGKTHKQRQWIE